MTEGGIVEVPVMQMDESSSYTTTQGTSQGYATFIPGVGLCGDLTDRGRLGSPYFLWFGSSFRLSVQRALAKVLSHTKNLA